VITDDTKILRGKSNVVVFHHHEDVETTAMLSDSRNAPAVTLIDL
jgi:hypothetical protein